jgi:hypothetical protein
MPDFSRFQRGAAAVKTAAAGTGGGGFTPRIIWKDDQEKKFVQFLTPMSDIPTVPMHQFIHVSKTEDGKGFVMRDFIIAPDEGEEPYDPIEEKFGERPSMKSIALAVELEPVWETVNGRRKAVDFNVKKRKWKDKDSKEHSGPAVGLVINAPSNFFGHLATIDEDAPIEEQIFAVTRNGKDTNTSYTFVKAGNAIELELPEDQLTNLDSYLEELADPERMRKLIEPLADDWPITKYPKAKDKDKKKSGSSSRSNTTTSAATTTSTASEDVYEEPAEEEPAVAAEAPARSGKSSRFANLHKELNGN